jgi:hypothetical protein
VVVDCNSKYEMLILDFENKSFLVTVSMTQRLRLKLCEAIAQKKTAESSSNSIKSEMK